MMQENVQIVKNSLQNLTFIRIINKKMVYKENAQSVLNNITTIVKSKGMLLRHRTEKQISLLK